MSGRLPVAKFNSSQKPFVAFGCPIQPFVEFTPVEPNTAASGAIVNFDTLAVGHDQGGVWAAGRFHNFFRRIGQGEALTAAGPLRCPSG
jgi:hypothetical protein